MKESEREKKKKPGTPKKNEAEKGNSPPKKKKKRRKKKFRQRSDDRRMRCYFFDIRPRDAEWENEAWGVRDVRHQGERAGRKLQTDIIAISRQLQHRHGQLSSGQAG